MMKVQSQQKNTITSFFGSPSKSPVKNPINVLKTKVVESYTNDEFCSPSSPLNPADPTTPSDQPNKKRKIVTYSRKNKLSKNDDANEADTSSSYTSFKPLTEEISLSIDISSIIKESETLKKKKAANADFSFSSFLNSSSPSSSSIKKKKQPEQSFLDFGQKNFGSITCEGCGMMYSPGVTEDDQTHERFHKKATENLKMIEFPGWKDERVVKEFPADKSRIIMILNTDPQKNSSKITNLKEIIHNELGYVESTSPNPDEKIFIYVNGNKKIVGCIIAEPIEIGFPLIPDNRESADQKNDSVDTMIRCSKFPEIAKCGISRIWIHSAERRKGIATKLMEAVRSNFIYGYVIPKMEVAFTQPTKDGKQFFGRYVGSDTFLVYKP